MSISVQIFSLSILDFIVLYSGFYSKETVVQLDLLGKHTSIYNPASPLLFSTPHFIRSGYGYDRIGINMLVSLSGNLGFFKINYFNWRLITLQYCSGFCHTLT